MKNYITSMVCIVGMFLLFTSRHLFSQENGKGIDIKTQAEVIQNLCENLRGKYVFPETAEKMINDIKEKEKNSIYTKLLIPDEFAKQLTIDLQNISKDKHILVRYSPEILPDEDVNDMKKTPKYIAESLLKKNYGFEKVEIMDGNIGYIKLNGCAPGDLAGETAVAAMNFVANTDALIIDLRFNSGGMPDIPVLMISYLIDGIPVHLSDIYFRKDNKILQNWTLPYVPGKRYGTDKGVYILTSNRTFSAAEDFSYNLQALKRATIIGEITGGGANPGSFFKIHDHFSIFIPEGRAVNPITGTNWEGKGVIPDMEVSKENALAAAHLTALKSLLEKEMDESKKTDLKKKIDTLEKKSKENTAANK